MTFQGYPDAALTPARGSDHPIRMKSHAHRKSPRFFIVNPLRDRRRETRFESTHDVVVRVLNSGKTFPAVAFDVGERGLKIDLGAFMETGSTLQIAFPNASGHVRCFGRVVWSKPSGADRCEAGVYVNAWHGIVEGSDSWKRFKGFRPKRDRRFNRP